MYISFVLFSLLNESISLAAVEANFGQRIAYSVMCLKHLELPGIKQELEKHFGNAWKNWKHNIQ